MTEEQLMRNAFDMYFASLLSMHFHPGFQRDTPEENRLGARERINACATLATYAMQVRNQILYLPNPHAQEQQQPTEETQEVKIPEAKKSHDVSDFFSNQKGHSE